MATALLTTTSRFIPSMLTRLPLRVKSPPRETYMVASPKTFNLISILVTFLWSLSSYRDTELKPCQRCHSSLHVSYRCPLPVTPRPTYYRQSKKGKTKINEESTYTQGNHRTIKRSSGNNIRPGQQKSSGQSCKPKQKKRIIQEVGYPRWSLSTRARVST